jgi:hypothetical protein
MDSTESVRSHHGIYPLPRTEVGFVVVALTMIGIKYDGILDKLRDCDEIVVLMVLSTIVGFHIQGSNISTAPRAGFSIMHKFFFWTTNSREDIHTPVNRFH